MLKTLEKIKVNKKEITDIKFSNKMQLLHQLHINFGKINIKITELKRDPLLYTILDY